MERTIADEIADVSIGRPHVVILGAGASRAALPTGDRQRRRLPAMTDFVEVVGLQQMLDEAGIEWRNRNFEDVHSDLFSQSGQKALSGSVERAVFEYFAVLELPEHPTIYDRLVLSLRPKDIIATFNWDPFLIQALQRNNLNGKHPPHHRRRRRRQCPEPYPASHEGLAVRPPQLSWQVDKPEIDSEALVLPSTSERRTASLE